MKTLKIEIPSGYEIDKEKSTFENIVFNPIGKYYPTSVKEIKDRPYFIDSSGSVKDTLHCIDPNQLSTEERAKAFLALMQLVELRDAWNEIDGGKEFYTNAHNHVIEVHKNKIYKFHYGQTYKVLHFRKEETRDKFLETFRDLIEQAKELI